MALVKMDAAGAADIAKRLKLRAAWDTVHVQKTITHAAANTAFYPDFWDGLDERGFTSLRDLAAFPVLRKANVAAAGMDMVSRTDPPDAIRDTSGTTGVRLPVYTSSAEDAALADLRRQRSRGHPRTKALLRILPPPRRLKPAVAPAGSDISHLVMHALPFDDLRNWWTTADFLMSVLSQHYVTGDTQSRIELIHCTPPPLFSYLTREIEGAGVDPSVFRVKSLLLTGGPLSSPAQSALETAWGAPVVSTFSCTEIRGEALPCPHTPGRFHMSHSAYAEVVGPDGCEVAEGSVGELVLTGLYPYQRVMPMIRYATGDIARRVDAPCACGSVARSFEILGRRDGVLVPRDANGVDGPPVPTLAVLDAIEGLPQVPVFPFPRFKLEQSAPGGPVHIWIETVDPRCFDASARAKQVAAEVRASCPTLARFLDDRGMAFEVTFVPKNTISDFVRLYPGR